MELSELTASEQELVGASFLFRGVAEETVKKALSDPLAAVRQYAKGEVVFDPERFERSVGIVLAGRIRVFGGGSPRYLMRTLTKGDPFGAAAVFSPDEVYVSRITAETKSRVIFFPQTLLARLLVEVPAVAENYIVFLSERVRFLNEKIRSLSSPSTEDALLNWLRKNAVPGDGGYEARLPGSYSALAEALNMGRASLYRALEDLEEKKKIEREGKIIRIPDLKALSRA